MELSSRTMIRRVLLLHLLAVVTFRVVWSYAVSIYLIGCLVESFLFRACLAVLKVIMCLFLFIFLIRKNHNIQLKCSQVLNFSLFLPPFRCNPLRRRPYFSVHSIINTTGWWNQLFFCRVCTCFTTGRS